VTLLYVLPERAMPVVPAGETTTVGNGGFEPPTFTMKERSGR
jgi:hypothetical protein